MATPTYKEARAKFYGTGYELRDYLARVISGKNPDGSSFEHDAAGVADASITLAKLATDSKTTLKAVVVHNGTSYPTRPSGFASVEFVGPTDPGVLAQNGDTWVATV